MSYVPRYNNLAHECYWEFAKKIEGARPGDLGQYSANQDDMIALLTAILIDQGYDLFPDVAVNEAEDAVWNMD